MSDNSRYCMGCMRPINADENFCPHCQYPADSEQGAPYLALGEIINDRYLVGKVLGMTNDAISYIGLDRTNGKRVTINEYFPNKIAKRASGSALVSPKAGYSSLYDGCLKSFLGLYRGVKMFKEHTCLPSVTHIFQSNDTAYSICEYKECMSLKHYFEKTKRTLTAAKAVAAFLPVLNALKALHKAGIVHGNINPSTIRVGIDGRLNLTGFMIPQCHSEIAELNSRPVSGFSPLEMYDTKTAKPESDIYSIMAVMFYAITGTVLPRATDRTGNETVSVPVSMVQTIPRNVLDAMNRSLSVYTYNRISDIDDLIAILNPAKTQAPPVPIVEKREQRVPERKAVPRQAPVQNNKPAVKPKKKKHAEEEEEIKLPHTFTFAFTAFLSVILFAIFGFSILYSTVLYKEIEVPFLENILGPVSFLPMNQKVETTEDVLATTEPVIQITEQSYATVIDFTKLTYDEIVTNENYQRNFSLLFKKEASDTIEKGHIIRQNATVGESVPVGTEIVLVVSTGVEQIVVPDVRNMTEKEATEALKKAGFIVSKLLIENKSNKTPGTVYRTSIEAGKSVDKGTRIVIEVWDKVPESTTSAATTTKPGATTTRPGASTTKPSTTRPATSTTKPTTTKPTVTTGQ